MKVGLDRGRIRNQREGKLFPGLSSVLNLIAESDHMDFGATCE